MMIRDILYRISSHTPGDWTYLLPIQVSALKSHNHISSAYTAAFPSEPSNARYSRPGIDQHRILLARTPHLDIGYISRVYTENAIIHALSCKAAGRMGDDVLVVGAFRLGFEDGERVGRVASCRVSFGCTSILN